MSKPFYLIITPFFPSAENWRGTYCFDFAHALAKEKVYNVRVFVPGRGSDYNFQGIDVYRFPVKMLPSATFPFLFIHWNCNSFLNKVTSIGINYKKIAVCHGHTAFCGIYPLAIKKINPACLTLLHHHDLASFGLNLGILRNFLPHKILNYHLLCKLHEAIDCHVFISEQARRSFLAVPDTSWCCYEDYKKQMKYLKFFKKAKIKHSIVLPNGVDTTIFKPSPETSNKNENKAGTFVIGCIANFSGAKDQITLLKALNILREKIPWVLHFIGSGKKEKECLHFIKKYNLQNQVMIEHEYRHELLPNFYWKLDLFVLPSYFEGFGCVFTEAAACGIPFITCEGQGISDYLPEKERHYWLVPAQRPDLVA